RAAPTPVTAPGAAAAAATAGRVRAACCRCASILVPVARERRSEPPVSHVTNVTPRAPATPPRVRSPTPRGSGPVGPRGTRVAQQRWSAGRTVASTPGGTPGGIPVSTPGGPMAERDSQKSQDQQQDEKPSRGYRIP